MILHYGPRPGASVFTMFAADYKKANASVGVGILFLLGGYEMAVRVTRNAGMLLLGLWLLLSGLSGLAALPIPGVLMAVLALLAGVLILVQR